MLQRCKLDLCLLNHHQGSLHHQSKQHRQEGLVHDNLHHVDHQDQYELLYHHFEAKVDVVRKQGTGGGKEDEPHEEYNLLIVTQGIVYFQESLNL
jgi:hypothetical protein